jgi:branched-chain amino acid transport system permease protein
VHDTPVQTEPSTVKVGRKRSRATSRRRPFRPGRILGAASPIVLLALPLYMEQAYLRAGEGMMIGAVGAIGLTLLVGQAGQLSLAQGFFLLVGGTAYTVLAAPTGEPLVGFGLPPLVAMVGAVSLSAVCGLAFAPVAGRLRGIYLGLASLSLVFIGLFLGQRFISLTGGTASGRIPEPFSLFGITVANTPDLTVFGVPFGRDERLWYLFLLLFAGSWLLARGPVRGRTGRAWRAIRDNEYAAAAMGVGVMRTKATAFTISSAYAGLAGVMTVMWLGILKPDESEYGTFGIDASIAVLAMVLIGGAGSVGGAVLGAVLVIGVPFLLTLGGAQIGGLTSGVLTAFVYGAAIVFVMLIEPRGLAGIGDRLRARFSRSASPPGAASTGPSETPNSIGESS